MNGEIVTITKDRLAELEYAEKVLNALYAGGVSSWEWYEDSLEDVADD